MPKTSPPDFYYLESDGQVFLVKRGKTWQFPSKKSELPCKFVPVFRMPMAEGTVLFAKPILSSHPFHWFQKDELIGRRDVSSLVQGAVNRSLARAASKVAIIEDGKVLMVKAGRGMTKGIWNLPGGSWDTVNIPAESAAA